jgi:hypothetical protein
MIMRNEEFKKLEVDKKNDAVSYNDEVHAYWTTDGLMKCISATTLIHMFSTFDGEFWGRYKALEAVMGVSKFKDVKPRLLATKKFNEEILEEFNIDVEIFEAKLAEILAEWDEKRDTACARGTDIHLGYELKTLEQDYAPLKKFGFKGFDGYTIDTSNIIREGQYVIPEMLISRISEDGILRVAGQADLVIVNGNKFSILDYKTNKEIKTKSFFDRAKRSSARMKYPLNNLDDVNFWHYTLQLSLYAWMILKANPHMELEGLYLLHHDHDDNKEVYQCEYKKTEVERMLAYYKQQIQYEQHKEKNAKPQ